MGGVFSVDGSVSAGPLVWPVVFKGMRPTIAARTEAMIVQLEWETMVTAAGG